MILAAHQVETERIAISLFQTKYARKATIRLLCYNGTTASCQDEFQLAMASEEWSRMLGISARGILKCSSDTMSRLPDDWNGALPSHACLVSVDGPLRPNGGVDPPPYSRHFFWKRHQRQLTESTQFNALSGKDISREGTMSAFIGCLEYWVDGVGMHRQLNHRLSVHHNPNEQLQSVSVLLSIPPDVFFSNEDEFAISESSIASSMWNSHVFDEEQPTFRSQPHTVLLHFDFSKTTMGTSPFSFQFSNKIHTRYPDPVDSFSDEASLSAFLLTPPIVVYQAEGSDSLFHIEDGCETSPLEISVPAGYIDDYTPASLISLFVASLGAIIVFWNVVKASKWV